jgi:hypothetical protein
MTFEEFALDHQQHAHCRGCNGCIIDPNPFIQQFQYSVWCIGCRERIKKNTPAGKPLPWTSAMEWN